MGSNYIAEDATITPSIRCIHDSTVGYSADFSKNGEVDGWEYFDSIHTYGCWGGFLFGTFYEQSGTIGRYNVFRSVNATTHYFIRLVMKYNPWPRSEKGIHSLPNQGKIRWRSLQSTNWDTSKEIYFNMEPDNKWHTYIINVGIAQFWQGDINDLRIWTAVDGGADGDEFFIRAIDIFSTESHECRNTGCEKFIEYSHPCPWIGLRATLESKAHEANKRFTIDYLTEFIININDYGNEIVKVKEVLNGSGREVANVLAKAISRTNIGGYSEVQVEYTDDNVFKIYSGTIHENSSVEVIDNDLARYLKFFASEGSDISTKTDGETPVNGYSPLSSFHIKTHQAYGLLDNDERTAITFNPFQYSLEGGRRDWLSSGTGIMSSTVGEEDGDGTLLAARKYFVIRNDGRTIIDFNHPFNASGRIKKIWAQCTLDDPNYQRSTQEDGGRFPRKANELSDAKIMIVRPKRDGTVEVIYEFSLNNRDPNRGYYDALYSITQEGLDIDVDVFVNKGDMLAVWNANMYAGKSVSGGEYDCQFYQVSFKPEIGEIFNPGRLYGDGSSGLLIYAHGLEAQKRLYLDIDLGHRYNIEKIDVKGEALNTLLEYNIARCLDINWQCDLFGHTHWTHYRRVDIGGDYEIQRPNTFYGLDNLNDGVYNVPDGLACDSYSLTTNTAPAYHFITLNGGPGLVPTNPYYFWVNGDEEWLAVWLHANDSVHGMQSTYDFDDDPVTIYLHFPHEKQKKIYKSKMYFKEKSNFRSFALSTYGGFYYTLGDADDYHYDLLPGYTKITLDNVDYYEGSANYDSLAPYLFKNPCHGNMIYHATSRAVYEWDPIYSKAIKDFSPRSAYGAESGFFFSQSYEVDNSEEWNAARRVDWQVIEHQWEPVDAKGFRIYCDFHKSTKITELELYGVAEDIGSNLAGGIVVTFSDYGELWWPTESVQTTEESVEIFIGDSPRYLSLEIIPVTETVYNDVIIYVKTEDLYAGRKGCEYIYYSGSAKTNVVNEGQLVEVKNTYGAPYDLYIDIAPGKLIEEGLLFYSDLSDPANILNPVMGPDARYYKLNDYPLLNQDYNCAINCNTFGLNNLIDGAKSYASYDDMFVWLEYKELEHGVSINFNNLPDNNRTLLLLPTLSRSRYWKIGHKPSGISSNIKEIRSYDNEDNFLDPEFYHDLNKTYTEGYVSERAPHLENISVVGSYYTLAEDQYITLDLDSATALERIEMYHEARPDYDNIYAGIDKYTKLVLRATKDNTGTLIRDYSYYNKDIILHGSVGVETNPIKDYRYNISLVDFACDDNWYFRTTSAAPEFPPPTPSTFSGTCGTPTISGSYGFDLACCTRGTDGVWHNIYQDDVDGTAGIAWQGMPFEMGIKVNFTSADTSAGSCFGLVGSKNLNSNYYNCYQPYYTGVQLGFSLDTGKFVLYIREEQEKYSTSSRAASSSSSAVLFLNTDYYCVLYSDGVDANPAYLNNVTYRAKVWTDGFYGSNLVADLTKTVNYRWRGKYVGFGSAYGTGYCSYDRVTRYAYGRVSDFYFNLNAQIKEYPLYDSEFENQASIRIPAGASNYISIPYDKSFLIKQRRYTIEFWVKFNSLPEIGERVFLIKNWKGTAMVNGYDQAFAISLYNTGPISANGFPDSPQSYRLEYWICHGTDARLQWYTTMDTQMSFYTQVDRWYYMIFQNANSNEAIDQYPGYNPQLDIDARDVWRPSGFASTKWDIVNHDDEIEIGAGNFDGWIQELRFSRGDDNTVNTSYGYGGNRYPENGDFVPTKLYETLYTFSIYVSDDNIHFGHYADVDSMFDYPEYYFIDGSIFADRYNSYLAIDLGHRHDIELIRRYGANDDFYIDRTTAIMYSNVDTDDPNEAFQTEITFDSDDDFYDYGGVLIDKEKWYLSDSLVGNETVYLSKRNGRLEQLVNSTIYDGRFYSTYGIRGNFDIEIKCDTTAAPLTSQWWAIFRVDMSDSEGRETYVNARIEYRSSTYRIYGVWSEDGGTYTETKTITTKQTGLRIIRKHSDFYIKYFEDGVWKDLENNIMNYATGKDVLRIHIGLECDTNYPSTKVYWSDFKVNSADKLVYRSTYNDARWMAIEMLNGDSVSKYLKKIGVYPDITKYIAPDYDNYNSSWTDLGPSVTGYSTGTNVALDTTVSGSTYIGLHTPENVTSGLINNERTNAWMSDNSSEQWLLIDLGEEKQIYRVKIYHGWSTEESDFMVEDYRIESSLDNQSFITQWTIAGNTSFTRTHDKADPFNARYIRMYITGYKADNLLYIKEEDGINFYEFRGACLREIEVYEYYGYSYVSSEQWPIVAINLRDQFYIQGYSLLGLFTENYNMDWSSDSSNFAWSDSVRQDPRKVTFGNWGGSFNYEQWVVIKRDTATYHNIDPAPSPAPEGQAYGIDYLKHVLIESTTKENPVNYPWWWSSNISTLSRDFSYPVELCTSSLKIAYPASIALDTVQFIEGSNWGVDSDMAFRDGLGFRWYIEDVDKLDTSEGYVFFGGLDGTNNHRPVEYRWYLSTLSGTTALQTGWNRPYFRLKEADEVISSEDFPLTSLITPTMPEYAQLQTFGFKFKGKGEAFNMNIDGAVIQRNHFQDSSKFDYGLYLAGSDYLECPLGEIDLRAGTIEFWLRPDYTFAGLDIHRRFRNRSLFLLGNVANDVFGFMINSAGFNLYYGNVATDLRAMIVKGVLSGAIDGLFHIAVAFSASGNSLGGDHGTIKLYINNGLVATNYDPWSYTDEKLFKFVLGGKGPLGLIENSSSLETTSADGVISNLRIYNYCKSDFTDSMNNVFRSGSNDLLIPSKMIEISQDNLTYYKVGDAELPFFYKKVPINDTVQIYVRSMIPDNLTGKEDRTAGILTQWDIGV